MEGATEKKSIMMDAFAPSSPLGRGAALLPGVALCCVVSAVAVGLERGETWVFGRAWLEALVIAILIGAVLRTWWAPGASYRKGIGFSAKMLLEIAIVLLGASLSTHTLLAAGIGLLVGIAGVVTLAILASFGLGRLLGLPWRMALLVACGNSICGNSAIAAVAPVIEAEGADIASSIAFTAVVGVAVVILMPFIAAGLAFTQLQAGVLAGLTVYAVPQVLAATAPIGPAALQMGTLVKLTRVLMLGPVVFVLSLLMQKRRAGAGGRARLRLSRMVPWFILGFILLAAARSAGALPAETLPPLAQAANVLTIVSMAALGLGTDLRAVAAAGPRVTATVICSLLLLGVVAFGLIAVLGIGV